MPQNKELSRDEELFLQSQKSRGEVLYLILRRVFIVVTGYTLAVIVSVYLLAWFTYIYISIEFVIFMLSGLIMVYGGIFGTNKSSPIVRDLAKFLRLGDPSLIDDKLLNDAFQSTLYYFVIGLGLLIVSGLFNFFG